MLPLHAIPTEVIRKGFRPYRGFATSLLIDLPKEDRPLLFRIGQPLSTLGAEKAAELALDVSPVFKVCADLFGYDLDLLKVGHGDCGVDGHDWNLYGSKERVPQVVRWRAFGGEGLLCIAATRFFNSAMVVGLADEALAPKMCQVFAAIGEMRDQKSPRSVDRPAGDLLEKVMLDADFGGAGFTSQLWHDLVEDQPTERQVEDLQRLRFSCRAFFGLPRSPRARLTEGAFAKLRQTRRPGQRIALIGKQSDFPVVLQPDEPMPRQLIEQVYAQSVKDIECFMQDRLADSFETQTERVHEFLHEEDLAVTVGDPAENERAFALAHFIGKAEAGHIRSMNDMVMRTTFGWEFRRTPAKQLLGTQSTKKLCGGHVMPGPDLIEMAITNVLHEADLVFCNITGQFALMGRVIASDDVARQRDMDAAHAKGHKLEKPYTALYRGLPVRVLDSYVVYHGDGSEGLACDYYLDHENQAVHFVSLYRVKAPKREE